MKGLKRGQIRRIRVRIVAVYDEVGVALVEAIDDEGQCYLIHRGTPSEKQSQMVIPFDALYPKAQARKADPCPQRRRR